MTKRSTKVPASQFLPADALAHVTGGGGKKPYQLPPEWEPEPINFSKASG
jgi:hypothetical protein